MSHDIDPDFEAWVQRARDAKIEDVASALGIRMPARGEYQGPCPACGGTDRFSINTKKQVFNCRGSKGGDAIEMVQHVNGCEFVAACEFINEEPPPRRESTARPRDPAVEKERREERRDDEIARGRQESADLLRKIEAATALFERGSLFGQEFPIGPVEGTLAEDYLEARGIPLRAISTHDLRFVRALPYKGFLHKSGACGEDGELLVDEEVELGAYHCMVAAMRDAQGRVAGVHRTYLDAGRSAGDRQPSGQPIKLRPPGDRSRNRAKKGTFRMGGGLILLSDIAETLAVAEGIETACSWRVLAREGEFGEAFAGAAIAAAYSLGNMCGAAVGSVPHPRPPRNHANATIPNGEPDMASAAMWIPSGVKRLVLLGDGDSDPAATRAALITGAARFRRLGLEVWVHMAGEGRDWNDELLAWLERRKVAA
jgi:hypothetical protein